jgi:hypothetical protein
MDANKDQTTETTDSTTSKSDGVPTQGPSSDGGEFKIEIRKLEVPVRPRGVLAE